MATINKFTDLEVWQISNELEKKIFQQIQDSPLAKDYALRDQINKSIGSIPDNIAEGFGRGGRLEFIQFLSIARASATELQSQLIRCLNRHHFNQETYNELFTQTELLGKKIGAFIQYLNQTDKSGPKFQHRVTSKNQQPTTNNQQPATSNQKPETINQQPSTSNQKPETSNQQPVTPNQQPETKNKGTINSKNAPSSLGAYPHANKVGNLLFLSGIGSRSSI